MTTDQLNSFLTGSFPCIKTHKPRGGGRRHRDGIREAGGTQLPVTSLSQLPAQFPAL